MIFWRKLAFQARKGEPGRALRLAATWQLPVGHNCHPLRFPGRRPLCPKPPVPLRTIARMLAPRLPRWGRRVTRGRACRRSPRDAERPRDAETTSTYLTCIRFLITNLLPTRELSLRCFAETTFVLLKSESTSTLPREVDYDRILSFWDLWSIKRTLSRLRLLKQCRFFIIFLQQECERKNISKIEKFT